MSMFVPKSWLNIRILLAGFKQLLRQTWDHQNIHTYPPLKYLSGKGHDFIAQYEHTYCSEAWFLCDRKVWFPLDHNEEELHLKRS